jgi:hypothetical protein
MIHDNPESLQCTGKRCRQVVAYGAGVQVEHSDGTRDRFCPRCWNRYLAEREVEQAARIDAMQKHAEAKANLYDEQAEDK